VDIRGEPPRDVSIEKNRATEKKEIGFKKHVGGCLKEPESGKEGERGEILDTNHGRKKFEETKRSKEERSGQWSYYQRGVGE